MAPRSPPFRTCRTTTTTRPPTLKQWVELLQLDPGILSREPPDDPAPIGVAVSLPGPTLGIHFGRRSDPAVQALPGQYRQLDLRHVEPTAVARCVDDLQPPRQSM